MRGLSEGQQELSTASCASSEQVSGIEQSHRSRMIIQKIKGGFV